uniref:Uncharacterized protein n=1 Tax=Aegilops tauschii TaxID=37682 RepID=N1R033_AEGTA
MANAEEEEDVEEPLDCGICFLPLDAPPTFMMIQQTFGRTVFAFCLRPDAEFWEKEAQCRVSLYYSRNILDGDDDKPPVQCYYQTTKAGVTCTDLSSGLPDPEDCFQAHVYRSVDLEDNEDTVEVTIRIVIN